MNMLRLFIFTFLVLAVSGCATVKNEPVMGSISGRTINVNDGAPVSAANVRTDPPTHSVTTEAQGGFSISDIPPGNYTITGTKSGYTTASVAVTVAAGKTTIADLRLAPLTITDTVPTVVPSPRYRLLETVRIDSRNSSPTVSQMTLDYGTLYTVVITGVYSSIGDGTNVKDAQSTFDAKTGKWTLHQLMLIDEQQATADRRNQEKREYIFYVTGKGKPITFRIYDTYYADNQGWLEAQIYLGHLEFSDLPQPVKP